MSKDYGTGSKRPAPFDEGMGKDPIRNNSADAGNSTSKPGKLNLDTLLNQNLAQKLPRKA